MLGNGRPRGARGLVCDSLRTGWVQGCVCRGGAEALRLSWAEG